MIIGLSKGFRKEFLMIKDVLGSHDKKIKGKIINDTN
jgi:hypothetical protein